MRPVPGVDFTVPGDPVAKGRPRFARVGKGVRAITPAKTRAYEDIVAITATQAMKSKRLEPFAGPLSVAIAVSVPAPASWSKKRKAAAYEHDYLPTRRPDLDNYVKAILDGCEGIVWHDDAQVVGVYATKRYGLAPCVRVTVEKHLEKPAP